ncbi:MAG: hypothetical protein ABI340_02615, partial [Nitrososphaera sp.]
MTDQIKRRRLSSDININKKLISLDMIRVYTKERHIFKLSRFLDSLNLKYEIYTIKDNPPLKEFELGVSYCYPRK